MNILKELQKVAVVSALVFYSLNATPANAAATVPSAPVPAGTCVGDATHDCVTTTGHISASVVTTLTINEKRALSFGNMAVACTVNCDGFGFLDMTPLGARTVGTTGADAFTLLHGAQANDNAASSAGNANSGGQQPGIYEVKTATEGTATQVYISFADASGNFIDYTGEHFYPTANGVTLAGPGAETFLVNGFTIKCLDTATGADITTVTSSDVFGHYCPTDGTGKVNIAVGARLNTVAIAATTAYSAGRYTGTYNVMVSY